MTVIHPLLFDPTDDVDMLVPQPDFDNVPAVSEDDEEMPVAQLEIEHVHTHAVEGPLLFLEGPQPMEVFAQRENSNPAEDQAFDGPQTSRFTWTIENFSGLDVWRRFSKEFTVSGCDWQVMIFPKGNQHADSLSLFLALADGDCMPYRWSCHAEFSLAVVDQVHNKYTMKKDGQNLFSQRNTDWGFPNFMHLSELHDPDKGYVVNDTVVVEAEVSVRKVEDFQMYDSKKETGYVGIKNQGATCYINSLLQTLYHIPYFRKSVYHMPNTETGSIALALLRLFYKLQYTNRSVSTKELTKSFGWNSYESFMQQDVQELNRVLCDKLEYKMKGTVVEGTIQNLFVGQVMNYVECIDIEFKSTRKESFYDLQVDVIGCKDVYSSFDKYVEVESLEGENKYRAEEHGLQDAKKGVLFTEFPPVLQLHLKRFEYDFMRDTMVKINDRYEFPIQLDLDRENGKYLSPDADRSVRNLYTLHSVLVHSGGVSGGHYYAFIRPTLGDQWYKFDDDKVTKEDENLALEEQYGGEANPGFTKHSNAYMLVYIRESDKNKIICDVDENDIAEDLRTILKKEKEEKEVKRRYKAEAHLFTNIKVSRDEDLREQLGKDICFDLFDNAKTRTFRTQKLMPFNLLKEEVAREFGIPVEYQRYWLWTMRKNQTFRLHRPLTPQEEAQKVGKLIREVSTMNQNMEFNLFLEVEYDMDLRPVSLPERTKEDMLLFFRLYDPEKEELRYVGRFFVKSSEKPAEILVKLQALTGFSTDEDIEIFEEMKFEQDVMCKQLDKSSSFKFNRIQDGDIIYLQKLLPPERKLQLRCPDVPSYFDYINNRLVVHFRKRERPEEDDFVLELAKDYLYDDVVERVAEKLDLDDPSRIRLTPHCCNSQNPKSQFIKYRSTNLLGMLVYFNFNRISDILYYEVLAIPLPELQSLKTLEVAFHLATKDEVEILKLRLPKQSTVKALLEDIKSKVVLSQPNAELRLLEVHNHKIFKIFHLDEKIEYILGYRSLRAEEIKEEEKNLGTHDQLIQVYHFAKENAYLPRNFGEPFLMVVHEWETIAEVKLRIQKRLHVSDEEFSKWKFASQSLGHPTYLQDTDDLFEAFQGRNSLSLGLEHPDTTPKRATNQNRNTSVKIYN